MQASKAVNKGKKHYDRIQKYKGMLNTPGLTPTQIKRYQKKQDSARWWMNYWMSPQPEEAIAEGKKHYDEMVSYEDLLYNSNLSKEDRQQYLNQRDSAKQWMNFWGQWITPEAAEEASRKHRGKGAVLAAETDSYVSYDPSEAEHARNVSSGLKNELEWQTFLLPYGSGRSGPMQQFVGDQSKAYGKALTMAIHEAPKEEYNAAWSERMAFMNRFRRAWGINR